MKSLTDADPTVKGRNRPPDHIAPLVELLEAQADALQAQAETLRAHARALEGVSLGPAPAAAAAPLATKSELAHALDCSIATIDRMVRDGMPYVRVGKTKRFDVGACRAWCESRVTAPAPAPAPRQPVSLAGVRRLSGGGR